MLKRAMRAGGAHRERNCVTHEELAADTCVGSVWGGGGGVLGAAPGTLAATLTRNRSAGWSAYIVALSRTPSGPDTWALHAACEPERAPAG
eukprot:475108-Prymnesium_polylepis.1